MKLFLGLFLNLLFFSEVVLAQHLSRPLGHVKSVKRSGHDLIFTTDFGNLKATVYSPSVIRIAASRNAAFDDFSYATVALPLEGTPFQVFEEKEQVRLQTDSLEVRFQRKPLRVSVYTRNGQLVNADEESFGTSWIGEEITTYKKLFAGERFIGLGEKTGDLDRAGKGYENWNTDFFGYDLRNDPLYSSIPFYIGIHDSLVYGIFLDNSSKTHFSFGASNNRFSSFAVEAGEMNYFIIHHSTVSSIISSYTWLTGRMPLPPKWSLGFHQCRYSYYPDDEVVSLARTFREKNIPCDAIWFDIHYMQDYKVFTWNEERFPDPAGMLKDLEGMGFKNVAIYDPGIKIDTGYPAYEDGLKKDVFLKYPDGKVWEAQVWPGWCTFTDYTKPEGRAWWGSLFKENIEQGMDGFWCDMNEIASWGQKTPQNLVFNFEGKPQSHRLGKNLYGFQMTRSTYEGTRELLQNRRPFILTRAGFAGLQRYTAIWTGDNLGSDDHMLLGVRMVNSLGLSGVSFAGYDVGGFANEVSPDLFAKWMSIGAFCPFFRSHKAVNSRDSEPWSYGEKTEEICRNYIQLRYNLMPYIYSAFYESTQNGMPVQRSLAIAHPYDPSIYSGNTVNQFLFGPSLLVVPSSSVQTATKVYLPEGEWYDLYSNARFTGPSHMYYDAPVERLPVFVKSGAIIPMQSPVQSQSAKPKDTLSIHVYASLRPSEFIYYEDAGDGYAFETGAFYKRRMTLDAASRRLTMEAAEGKYASHFRKIRLIFHGFENFPESLKVNGTTVKLGKEETRYIEAISRFDPLGSKGSVAQTVLPVTYFDFHASQMEITW